MVKRLRVAILADYLEEEWPSMDLVADMLYEHLRRAARELHDQGTFTYADQQIPQSELNAIFSSR